MDQPVEEHIDANPAPSSSSSLVPDAVPVGTPLPWSIVDADGTLLFTSGTILATTDARAFLFTPFSPQRGDLLDLHAGQRQKPAPQAESPVELTVKDMHLEIGALIGMRSLVGSGSPMHPCRIIGFAPNHSIFVTPPLQQGRPMP